MRTGMGLAAVVLVAGLSILARYSNGQAAPKAEALPTAAELQALVDAAQYRDALHGVLRVLELKGAAAAGYDRFEMLMLRAECLLQNREIKLAEDALADMHKEALSNGKAEWAARAGALELLLQRSSVFAYTPKTGANKEAISVLDRNKRPRALLSLYADELGAVKTKYDAALVSKALPPILEFARTAPALRELELATSGHDEKTTAMYDDLGKHAAALMNTATESMALRVEAIRTLANTVVGQGYIYDSDGNWTGEYTVYRGLTATDIENLKSDVETCAKIGPAAKELEAGLGSDPGMFKAAVNSATASGTKAQGLLQTKAWVR